MATESASLLTRIAPSVDWPVTVCVLFYGDHPDLAERFFSRLIRHTSVDLIRLRVGCNAVSEETRRVVASYCENHFPDAIVIDSDQNLFKCPMMRRLFHDDPLETRWIIWFDDDSFVFRDDWLRSLALSIERHAEVAMFGKKFYIHLEKAEQKLIEAAPWFREIPLVCEETEWGSVAPRVDFISGGFWAMRTSVLAELDWPDPQLTQHAEDFILGAALRQHGKRILQSYSGVAVNEAERRGPPDDERIWGSQVKS
ncbi:MAG: glycosyltransferase family 2 protein [Verrucomicrobiales bacterium]